MSTALRHRTHQHGLVFVAVLLLILLTGWAGQHLLQTQTNNSALQQNNLKQQARSIQDIRQSLLAQATLQGFNSHSHMGHLPCPASTPGGYAQTSCLEKPWGYLPIQSVSKVNYLNAGISTLWNALDMDANKHWMYALSEQVIQPNELGWSRWVNFNLPAITVEIGNTRHHGVVAVLSQHIEPVSNKEYRAQEPATLILEDELKRLVKATQQELMLQTLNSWGKTPHAHENLKATADGAAWHATDSGCSCRCTKTRCQCACSGNGRWVSNAPCDEKNPNCSNPEKGMTGQAQCMSSETQSCIFQGAAQLESGWPISRHEPTASATKSCRPSSKYACPLSVSNVACECFFSWPQAIVSSLDKHSISFGPKGHYSISP